MASYADEDEWLEELAAGGRRDIGGEADEVSVDDVIMDAPVAGGGGADMRARGDEPMDFMAEFEGDPEAFDAATAPGGPPPEGAPLEMEPGAGQPRLGELMEGAAPIGDDKFMQWAADQTRGVDSMDPAVVGVAPAAHSYEALRQGGPMPTDPAVALAAREMDDASAGKRDRLKPGVNRDQYTMMNEDDQRRARYRQRTPNKMPQGSKDFLAALANAFSGRSGGKNEMGDYLNRRDSRIAGEKAEADKGRREALQAQQRADAADRQRMLQDPNSPQNQRYQQQVRQLLGNDFDASTLTLADHQRYGGDFLKMQSAAQARAAQARAAQQAGEQKLAREDEKFARGQTEWNRQNAIRAEQNKTVARIAAGGRSAAAQAAEDSRLGVEARREQRDAAKELSDSRKQLSMRLASSKYAEFNKLLSEINASMPEKGKEIPGIGVWDGVMGSNVFTRWMQSEDAKDMQRLTRNLMDLKLRAATGANAPEAEEETFRKISGMGTLDTEDDFRRALEYANGWREEQEQLWRGGYGDQAWGAVTGGLAASGGAAGTGAVVNPDDGDWEDI